MLLSIVLGIMAILLILNAMSIRYAKGFAWAVFFMILLPKNVYFIVEQISLSRVIIVLLLMNFLINREYFSKPIMSGVQRFLVIIALFKIVSAFLGVVPSVSIERSVIYIVEIVLFYFLATRYLNTEKDIYEVFEKIFYAIGITAIDGFLQKYAHVTIVDYLPVTQTFLIVRYGSHYVFSTFFHPILLGVAMTFGWLMGFYLLTNESRGEHRLLIWFFILLMWGNLYFSNSRGPWLASILAALVLFYSSGVAKKYLIGVTAIIVSVLLLRPGVVRELYTLAVATFDPTTIEGSSFSYRFALWGRAITMVLQSWRRFLFGFGEWARRVMEVGSVESASGRSIVIESWDSEFATILFETGVIGFALIFFLLTRLGVLSLRKVIAHTEAYKHEYLLLLCSVLVLGFMMTNVKIFAQQIHYIFWPIVAAVEVLNKKIDRKKMDAKDNEIAKRSNT